MIRVRWCFLLLISTLVFGNPVFAEYFSISPELKPLVTFWIHIFTQYHPNQAVLHDSEDLRIIYQVLPLDPKTSKTENESRIAGAISQIRVTLNRIVEKNAQNLTPEELALLANIPHPRTIPKLVALQDQVRSQRGLSNHFAQSIERSGRYLPLMRRITASYGLPEDVIYLPHVESGFHPHAESPATGARGLWQFTPQTAEMYLRMDESVDERCDPVLATHAAAKLLKSNYQRLASWPLAITAYNHGTYGMERLVEKYQTRDIATILKHRGGSFGFASRNFYVSFLAARFVSRFSHHFFGDLGLEPPLAYNIVRILEPTFIDALRDISEQSGIIAYLNPALRRSVLDGLKPIPQGYVLRVPKTISQVAFHPSSLLSLKSGEPQVGERSRASPSIPLLLSQPLASPRSTLSAFAAWEKLPSTCERITDPNMLFQQWGWDFLNVIRTNTEGLALFYALPGETLDVFAMWANLPTVMLATENPNLTHTLLRGGEYVRVPKTSAEAVFERRKNHYQKEMLAYFRHHELLAVRSTIASASEPLFSISNMKGATPPWLIATLNPHLLPFATVLKGDLVYAPVIKFQRQQSLAQADGHTSKH